jgi:hydrogenase maturation protein HypF
MDRRWSNKLGAIVVTQRGSQIEPAIAQRLRLVIVGQVQGVGFRPFIYQLAHQMQLTGWVKNTSAGVVVELEGDRASLQRFMHRLHRDQPQPAQIDTIEQTWGNAIGDTKFVIHPSDLGGQRVGIPWDLSTCTDCLRELFDPDDRRYRYPFISCAHCGPRYSMITGLPYDRPRTTMAQFALCSDCQAEYDDPLNRRFHAQPIACPKCGPQLAVWDAEGNTIATEKDAISATIAALRQGQIVAVKGIGGFQLWVDARNFAAVQQLRERKHRPDKPFALMYPNLAAIQQDCIVSDVAIKLLESSSAPIVLLPRRANGQTIAANVAPDNPNFGVMLPYAPLHYLLLKKLQFPVVATSGNLAGELLCTDEHEALQRLGKIADYFLVHDRPIAHPIDDAVVKLVLGQAMVVRSGRGYAPTRIACANTAPTVLATGAHLKNTIALTGPESIHVSPHIGDLDNVQTFSTFEQTIQTYQRLYGLTPQVIACDRHPDYLSTQYATAQRLPVIRVQHHHAHIAAVMQEHHLTGEVLGIAWDGTGYGEDETIWGGEFLRTTLNDFERVGHLRQFPLLGGDRAAREPCRVALGVLYELWGDRLWQQDLPLIQAFTPEQRSLLQQMLQRGVQTVQTSSMGRLFDAVASLLDLHQRLSFEGQGAMAVEYAIAGLETEEHYPIAIDQQAGIPIVDWEPLIREMLEDLPYQSAALISAKFHNSLIAIIVTLSQQLGMERIVLGGGCFQNQYLLEGAIRRLQASGFQVYWPQRIPPNDGGIALGQAAIALQQLALTPNQPTSSA